MSKKGSRNAASHGTRPPGGNPRFQHHDRGRTATARRGALLKLVTERIGERGVALCAISVADLAHGVHRADTVERRQARSAFLDDLKATVAIYPITADTAERAGKIHAESSKQGFVIPFDDLLIGACALERGYVIATRNQRHFQKIPGLKLTPF